MRIKYSILTLCLVTFSIGNSFSSTLTSSIYQDTLQKDAQSYYNKGLSHNNFGKYPEAETEFLKALDLAQSPEEREIRALCFHYLGNIESWKSNFPQSIIYHKKAKALFSKLGDSEYLAISNNQISIDFDALGEYDSTLVYFQYNINDRALIDASYTVLKSYQGIAVTYAKLYNYKLAYRYLQEGIEYAEETGSKHSLGEIYYTAGRLFLNNHVNKDIALEYLLEADSIFAELDDSNYQNLARLSIGDVHFKTGNDSLAMSFYMDVATKVNPSYYSLISIANHKIGMVYEKRKDYDSALSYLQKSIDGMCIACPAILIHNTLVEAGRLCLNIGNTSQALTYLSRAKNIADQSKSGLEMVVSSEELAKYYQGTNNNDSALYYLNNAYTQAKELGLLQSVKSTAESLSKIHYSSGEFQASADYLDVSMQMNDSLASIEKYNEIAKLEMRFDIEKSEEERKLETQRLESEISKQKLIRNTSVAGVILFILIGLVILRAYRMKRRDNRLLSMQKAEILEISSQLQESGRKKLDFFTNISHEIRTPLTLIKAPLERMLSSGKTNPEIDDQLQIALKNTNKLKELLNQILDLQKLDEKLLSLDLSEFKLIAFCREIVSSFEGYCYQSNCRLIFESNISEAIVKFDRIRLQSIINNLLSNAFKYNQEGGLVQFKIDVNTEQLKLEIIDKGIGISEENLKRLGERYYQIEQSNSSVEGTGIGLAYVKELVQLMKGSIDFASVVNEGTTVSISLPCKAITIEAENPVSMEIKPREQLFSELEEQISDDTKDLPRILIIEDNFELRSVLRDLFAPSYQVIIAKDGQEGKEMAEKYIPDLIISDIMMPRIKGNELCRILKNNLITSHITIILFTAKDGPDSIVDGYDCGADDYIVKPFDTELLFKKVKNIIVTRENARKQFSFTDIERSSSFYSEFDKKFLQNCMSIIKDNLANSNFTVESLAENMNLHRRTLLRKFTALTGKSPVELIRHTRMSQAAELIRNKKYRVNEVALMIGYEDVNRFSQAFKQFHGVSPSAFK